MEIKETITVIYEKGQCSSASLDKRQFETEPLPMVHIISRDCKDEGKVKTEVLTYLQKELGREVKPCGGGDGIRNIASGFETNIQIAYN